MPEKEYPAAAEQRRARSNNPLVEIDREFNPHRTVVKALASGRSCAVLYQVDSNLNVEVQFDRRTLTECRA